MKRLTVLLTILLPLALVAPASAQTAVASATPKVVDDSLSLAANQKYLDENAKQKGWIVRPSGLRFKIIQSGYGKHPQLTDSVMVYYTGTLINHVVFDGTSPPLPAPFKLNGGLIQGWVEALQLMREGDRWLLVIPPNLGYGARGAGDGLIPPNQTLIFDIKLLSTTPAPKRGEKGYVPDPSDKDDQDQ
jgi:FKBP-type peptidyl-prolyl cis-trans isomerase